MKNNAALLFVRLLASLKKHKPINLQLMHLRSQISKYCDHCSSVQRGVWVISAAYTQRILHLNKGVFAVNYAPITFAIAIAFNISALQPLLQPLPLSLPLSCFLSSELKCAVITEKSCVRFAVAFSDCFPFFILFSLLQDEARKKAASTYLVESADMPPPRYQKDGTLPALYPNNMGKSPRCSWPDILLTMKVCVRRMFAVQR